IMTLSLPGGLSTLRQAFIRAITSWISSRLSPLAGTSFAASSPWRVMEKLSPRCTRSRSSENLAFASEAAIMVVVLMVPLARQFDRSMTSLALVQHLCKYSGHSGLLQLPQRLLNGIEVRQIFGRGCLFAVLHGAIAIDHEGGSRAHRTHAEQIRQQRSVSLGNLFIEIAGQ